MQINKSKKPNSRQSPNTVFDNDFASGFEDSKFEKFKPAIKALVVVILLVGAAWGAVAYFSGTDEESDTNKTYTPNSSQTTTDRHDNPQDAITETDSFVTDSSTQNSVAPSDNSQSQDSSNNSGSSSAAKQYDPSKCEPLNNEATRLRRVADQEKTTYDNSFAARKNYGDIYSQVRSEYGNSSAMYEAVKAEADRRYNAQEAQLNTLQTDWQNALSAGNTAYSKYQECRATL